MGISRFFVARPIFAWVIAIVIMLAGIGAILSLPIAQYPDVAPPTVNIRATYTGASAETLETSVTQVIEQQLTGIDGLQYFSSSSDSSGSVSISKGDYGLGLEVHGAPADRNFSHGGSNEGYENFLVAYTGSGDGVAVMTNGAQGNELGLEITRSVAAAYGWPSYRSIERASVPISAATRARLIGNYSIPGLGSFSITGQGSGLTLSLKEGVSEPLYMSAPNTFFILSTDMVLHVNSSDPKVSGRIVTGPFDVPFAKEAEAKP